MSNPLLGTFVHAVGGVSASTCYVPFQKVKKWSWNTYWLLQAAFAWFVFPVIIGFLTVPDLVSVFKDSPISVIVNATLLGAVYGFGGMCFGFAIRHIGYSLTYTISIGISAVLGTIVPLLMHGNLVEKYKAPGGAIIFIGMFIAIIGIAICGVAGYRKEADLKRNAQQGDAIISFDMKKGLILTLIAGVLSAVFGISLEVGAPVAEMAGKYGAGNFEGNASLILSTFGAFATNLVWFVMAGIKNNTLKEFTDVKGIGKRSFGINFGMSVLSGALWYGQFFFYGIAHVQMGAFKFASWVIHMSMLIFFSYIIGIIMKEWQAVSKRTYNTLILALFVLIASFFIMTYGSMQGA
ncbi:L-rhamnose/proton symporter RhaT [Flavobacterium sp. NG2]|uniref:L-rhamnose/proton symporter RhaT n=1 Tax=Flavobacterium sp. NG2 TaxID=3097547 RepID=UPI002A80A70D|nr:L-rhamnose/proton symporter RhaT [Flavobacterium sp. NG2]WPR73105.1 L-rhamnose/proton symporter RhaT [Flavobacterium sp. NG2]